MSKKDQSNVPEFAVKNVVATASSDVEDRLDLVGIARKVPDVEYNPERFPGLVMRLEEPRATFLIFSTGKMVVTGLRRASDAQPAVSAAVKVIRGVGMVLPDPVIRIENLVASGDLGVKIDLNMAAILLENAMYEPEVFPGLIYRMQDPKAVFLIFSTGKFVCTGIRDKETVEAAVSVLAEEVTQKDLEPKMEGGEFEDFDFL